MFDAAGLDAPARTDVLARMGERTRHYHTSGHLAQLWRRHRHHSQAAGFATVVCDRLIACCIAYHDAVYVAGATDNEALSAALWCRQAPAALPPGDVAWVAATILCTADHLAPPPATDVHQGLREWMLDLDLSPLAETPQRFARNMARLRAEGAVGTMSALGVAQRAFLKRMAAAPRIFRTPVLHDALEAAARANIAAALDGPA